MEHIHEFVDERQKSWCIHCGAWIGDFETNRDHSPSKSLLLKPYPENLPVIEVCKKCNEGFSLDEEYLMAFLGSVLAGSTEPCDQKNPKAAQVLERSEKLRARIERSKKQYTTQGGKTRCIWSPETERINRVVLKNARGHAFYEFGEPMLNDPSHILALSVETLPREQQAIFEINQPQDNVIAAWPEVGSRMFTRVLTGQDLLDGWVVVQEGIYRYAVVQKNGLVVRSVMFEYLATEVCWDP